MHVYAKQLHGHLDVLLRRFQLYTVYYGHPRRPVFLQVKRNHHGRLLGRIALVLDRNNADRALRLLEIEADPIRRSHERERLVGKLDDRVLRVLIATYNCLQLHLIQLQILTNAVVPSYCF